MQLISPIRQYVTYRLISRLFSSTNYTKAEEAHELIDLKPKQISQASNNLTDTFGRTHTYLRISLTERCNLRCEYCMPAEGVNLSHKSKLLTTSEVIQLADLFVREGVNKIRLTGGEPTLRKDLIDIVQAISAFKERPKLSMTTNGLTLTKILPELYDAGLNSLNVSLDSLRPERYGKITRLGLNNSKDVDLMTNRIWSKVMTGIDLALDMGFRPVKINCVVMKNFNEDEMVDFVRLIESRPGLEVRFIEFMPFGGNNWQNGSKLVPYSAMLDTLKAQWPDMCRIPGNASDTAKLFHIPGFSGNVGFITSMTEHFCGGCNRLRITADGNLKVCLFGNAEVSLRDALRANISEEDLLLTIRAAVRLKKKQHAALSAAMEGDRGEVKEEGGSQRSCRSGEKGRGPAMEEKRKGHLTHLDEKGRAKMVDVGGKDETRRVAVARGVLWVGEAAGRLISEGRVEKGDVFSVARVAGIMAAKATSSVIPLCHQVPLSSVKVDFQLDRDTWEVKVFASASCEGRTGVEMEALLAASVACLTVYDMVKSVAGRSGMAVREIRLLRKTGGQKGDYCWDGDAS